MNANSNRCRRDQRAGYLSHAFMLISALLFDVSCSKTKPSDNSVPSSSPPPSTSAAKVVSGEKHFPLTGEIISINAAQQSLLVHHSDIKDYMPSMTMEFKVGAGDLAVAKVGQKIRAEFIVGKNDEMRLEQIWPDNSAATAAVAASMQALRQDTLIRGKSAYREVGETLPEFTLFDQSGQAVQISRFRGKMVMLNFIYTRCPIATMCPAATAKMMVAQQLAREAGVTDIEFISITLDPVFDTPGVLREYADARGIDTKNFSFLTGPERAIKDLLEQFGVIADFDGNILKHSLATILVDANGKIIHRADGSQWEPKDFVAKMKR